jgi:hypothetical protein
MTAGELSRLIETNTFFARAELVEDRILLDGGYEFCFDWAHARAAAEVGVRVRSCVDAVLEEPDACAELLRRLFIAYFGTSADAAGSDDNRSPRWLR